MRLLYIDAVLVGCCLCTSVQRPLSATWAALPQWDAHLQVDNGHLGKKLTD